MEKGNKVIWDSGFGYDIGYYVKTEKNVDKILLATGVYSGMPLVFPSFEISDYSKELHETLAAKYGHYLVQYVDENSKYYKELFNNLNI